MMQEVGKNEWGSLLSRCAHLAMTSRTECEARSGEHYVMKEALASERWGD